MKTKCQLCEEEINATEAQIAKAAAGEIILMCRMCKSLLEKDRREAEEYKRLYDDELRKLNAQHTGTVAL